MRFLTIALMFLVLVSCNETLLEKPENLIPQEKMVEILQDLAIVNAAKTTNLEVLRENGIEPMDYIFKKYDIDSLQFVESDRYYASLPVEYEKIYKKVETNLEKKSKELEEQKKLNDSIRVAKEKLEREKAKAKKAKDTLR
ncbi:DUF4296 domain-containing protein [Zobellia galactanivorans]|nr:MULTISPECIES: DUF4296 domain-containing protein [Zobellia]MBU3028160.1 DUF4296 domain-containing protein [Zobellia galactanivorans]MDO6808441.1 DUF4296 domain-containing protein [Zobellia galactanivorans]OWW26423.1 hypothetical protein B4Q04_01700 [Zobellia sp. OII3]